MKAPATSENLPIISPVVSQPFSIVLREREREGALETEAIEKNEGRWNRALTVWGQMNWCGEWRGKVKIFPLFVNECITKKLIWGVMQDAAGAPQWRNGRQALKHKKKRNYFFTLDRFSLIQYLREQWCDLSNKFVGGKMESKWKKNC